MGKSVVILGSTGSIGRRGLDVVRSLGKDWRVIGLAAGRRWKELSDQAKEFLPMDVVISEEEFYEPLRDSLKGYPIRVHSGESQVVDLAGHSEADFVLCAIVGAQSLVSVIRAIETGKTVGLASKEALVLAGEQILRKAREKNVPVLPVDSEHSAVFQSLLAGQRGELTKIILTASGGPFRDWPKEKIEQATLKEALAHPTWSMGQKITIDSATMMNKALEIIEAKFLFDMSPQQIDVVIHPESIVHSLVEFCDGSVIGQLSIPDMAIPIQYSLTWPKRNGFIGKRLDLTEIGRLNFYKPDFEKFPALRLAYDVVKKGGTCGAVFNAANERAVEAFISGKIKFGEITRIVENVLNGHAWVENPGMNELLEMDRWARKEVDECLMTC